MTGATGKLDRHIVERLLERVPSEQVGVSVRVPGKARDLTRRGVRVRRGDFDDPASLDHAFAGARQVLLVSLDRTGEGSVTDHRRAIDATAQAASDVSSTARPAPPTAPAANGWGPGSEPARHRRSGVRAQPGRGAAGARSSHSRAWS
ncbi:NAD(P)H-binding protein [Nocardia takedensis]